MTTPVTIRRRMTQSMIAQNDICAKRTEFDLFHETLERGNVNRVIGSGYHAGNAEGYLQMMRGETLDVDRMVDAGIKTFNRGIEWDDYTDRKVDEFSWTFQPKTYRAPHIELNQDQAVSIVEQLIRFYWDKGYAWDKEVVAVEFRMNLPYLGAPEGWDRGGAVDLIVVDGGGGYILDDHKTSKKKWTKKKGMPTNPQAAWYLDEWRTYAKTNLVKFCYDVMAINVDSDTLKAEPEFERRWAPRTEAQIDMTLERGRDLAKLIDQGGPFLPNTESFLCSPHYCDHWKICPYGSTLNFVDEPQQ